jgi:hypothetical protein
MNRLAACTHSLRSILDKMDRQLETNKVSAFIQGLSFMIGLFATMPLVKIMGYSLYLWLVAVALVLVFARIRLAAHDLFLLLSIAITFCLSYLSLDHSYRVVERNNFIEIFAVILLGCALSGYRHSSFTKSIVSGVVFASKLQVVWILGQILCWTMFSLDLNDLTFRRLLHVDGPVSQFKASGFVATGFCWNAGGIVACLILGFLLEKNIAWRIAILVAGVLTQSSTVIIGLLLCVIYALYKRIFKNGKPFDRNKGYIGVSVCAVALAGAFVLYLSVQPLHKYINTILDFVKWRFSGLFNASQGLDSSSAAHFAYYINLPALFSRMSVKQILFGYGINCSGLPYTVLTKQYYGKPAWMVESDPVNTLLGIGIVGFAAFAWWMYEQFKAAYKHTESAFAILVILVICGFFYNVFSVVYYSLVLIVICLVDYESHTSDHPDHSISGTFFALKSRLESDDIPKGKKSQSD